MLRTMNSPADTHNDHLRHLLDQRTTRANHGRFPSLSEMSDSPSVYSHAHFSPHPLDQADIDAHTNSFNFHIPSSHRGRPHSPDRQTMHDPNASVLDFDEDPRLSYASSSLIQDHDQDEQYSDEEGESDVVDGEADPRMSMLGPKMRFHGLAPWEMGEEPVEEEGEDSDSGQSKAPSIFHRGRNHAGKKGLGIGSSQRAQGASRPSADSSRSQTKSKKSSDTSSSNSSGALQALAQASMSSTSLVTPSPSPAPTGRHKFTMGFGRPRTPSRVGSGSTSPIPPDPSPQSTHFQYHISNPSPSTASPRSEFARPDGYRSPGRSSTSSQPEVHPYANPDLVVTYAQQNTSQSPNRSNFQTPSVTRKASTSTLTHSVLNSSQNRASNYQGKEISSPITINGASPGRHQRDTSNGSSWAKDGKLSTMQPPAPNSLPGWQDNLPSPTITLISLQEAQALAKERSRSATSHATVGTTSLSQTFPEPDNSVIHGSGDSPTSPANRTRARSISAGARAKTALHSIVGNQSAPRPERRDSEPAIDNQSSGGSGKSLKHKKSGFMRLFNASKEKERERTDRDRSPPPPVPTLSDAYAPYSSNPNISAQAKSAKSSRVPVPQLFPSIVPDSSSQGSYLTADYSTGSVTPREPKSRATDPNARRTGPSLSIVTQQHVTSHSQSGPSPRSAPPGTTDFPSLSLRPVSTLFSAHFTDHIVTNDPDEIAPDTLLDTSDSISPGTGNSPMTPGFPLLSSTSDTAGIAAGSDQSSVVQALQDQIVTARKAWQRQIWELEGQVRDLKAEVEDLRAAGNDKDYCEMCGRGGGHGHDRVDEEARTSKPGVVNRPRARTGGAARFGSAV